MVGLYLLGTLAYASQYVAEGVDASTAISFLSLERILVRGVGVLVTPTGIGTILALLIVTLFIYWRRRRRRENPQEAEGTDSEEDGLPDDLKQGMRRSSTQLFVMVLLLLLLATPLAIPGILCLLVPATLLYLIPSREWQSSDHGWWVMPTFAGSLILALGLTAILNPAPLPIAHVEAAGKDSPVDGAFLSHDNATWLVQSDDDIVSFPDHEVAKVEITDAPDEDEQRNYEYIADLFESLWP